MTSVDDSKSASAAQSADVEAAAVTKSIDPPQDKPVAEAMSSSSASSSTAGGIMSGMSSSSFKLLLLILMVLQNSGAVLVGRHTRTVAPSKDELYVVNHLIVSIELGKLTLALILEHFHTKGHLWQSVKDNVLDRPIDALKIIIPSLLYLIQNSLLYVALSNLTAPIFQVMYQCKLLTTALVSVIMLGRRYSPKQWVCLTLLGVGVAIVVLGESDDKTKGGEEEEESDVAGEEGKGIDADPRGSAAAKLETEDEGSEKPTQNLFVGLVAVTIACMCSALAGVYFEKVLKKPTTESGGVARPPVSMWMRNVQMAFFSVCIGLIQYSQLKGDDAAKPFAHGFTTWVWILVGLQAGGGMLVAAVIKYADNVLKGLATGVSVVFASICSFFLFGTGLSLQFTFGAAIILSSVFFFSNDIPGSSKAKVEKGSEKSNGVEMKKLLPK